ncbi:MAG: alkyl hydroperoxide reductase [Flavobacteriales bacterium CG_4_9_14_3_um_filter_40_17]|nr:MAG: alkyl hydroperoxide reductase [Flavobacteriales bacterium CG_4_9_14_3_um_filter_40_17]
MTTKTYRTAKEASGLKVGEYVKNFIAVDLHGKPFELKEALQKGSLVLIFYRGHWCPVCNKHLKKLEAGLDKIYAKGAQVIAISPEKSEFLKLTADKTKVSFRLLFDEDYRISKLFDVYFKPGTIHRLMYNNLLGAKLKEAHSDDSEQLPIPATFIIDSNAKIVWRHFDPDYTKRSSVEDILAHLP